MLFFDKNHVTCSFITHTEKLLDEIGFVDVIGSTFSICILGSNMMTVRQKHLPYICTILNIVDSSIEPQQICVHNIINLLGMATS